MISVKVLGTGCPNCKKVEQVAKRAIANLAIDAEIIKVTDMADIMTYDILSTPGLVINGELVSAGRIPEESEIISWLANALET